MTDAMAKLDVGPLGWRLITVMGASLLLGGVADLSLGLYPLQLGTPEWEYGAISNFLNRLPLAGLGVAFLLAASLAGRRRLGGYVWSTLLAVVAVLVLLLGLLYATNLPLILGGFAPGAARTGGLKAVAKTAVQVPTYSLGFFIVAILGFRAVSRFDRGRG
ncbi:MAG: hypothetical protein ACKVZ0_07890 [Gemmatimonadales bacterium]